MDGLLASSGHKDLAVLVHQVRERLEVFGFGEALEKIVFKKKLILFEFSFS